jgi:hypothetical protein
MIMRGVALAVAILLTAAPVEAQALRRVAPKAFPFSVTPFVALGFGGARAARDPMACRTVDCDFKVGSGPQAGLELQLPLVSTFGLGVTGVVGRPSRVTCDPQCLSSARITAIHATGLVLWRFKARAPVYFGIGPAISYLDPGPLPGQQTSVTEVGGSLVLAYDFAFSPRVGGRVGWWNYFMKPSTQELPAGGEARNLAWDTQIGLGVRFVFGS